MPVKSVSVSTKLETFKSKWDNTPTKIANKAIKELMAKLSYEIHTSRLSCNLTQQQLSELSGVSQAVIARMEHDNYDGRSIDALIRVATALGKEVKIDITPRQLNV